MLGSATEMNGEVPQRSCPKYNGYWESWFLNERPSFQCRRSMGGCLKCGYRLMWVVILGKRLLANLP
jgi:hypothetical protein